MSTLTATKPVSLSYVFRAIKDQSKLDKLIAESQAKGYTHSKTFDFKHSDGRPDCKMQTEWTQKGRLFLYQLLQKHGILPMIERDDQEAGH